MNIEIIVNKNHKLFDNAGMYFIELPSIFKLSRIYAKAIIKKAPPEIIEGIVLEQQITELIKNGIKHGNKNDKNKKIKIWFSFAKNYAHLIVEDEGAGFKDLEKWNDFNRKRIELLKKGNIKLMSEFLSFKTENSDEYDGGNGLFAALEYWNGGVVMNDKRNSIAVLRFFNK